jgi:hypothetical protein
MFDFDAAVQTVLSPVVTVPVIAVLALTIVGTIIDGKRRLRNQIARDARTITKLLSTLIPAAEKEMRRRENKAIEFTFDTLRAVGWDKLARNEVTFEDFIFGARPETFTMTELKKALYPDDPFDPNRVGGGSGLARGGSPSVDDFIADAQGGAASQGGAAHTQPDEGTDPAFRPRPRDEDAAGLEALGPRPYHTAKMSGEPDFTDRSPRAG